MSVAVDCLLKLGSGCFARDNVYSVVGHLYSETQFIFLLADFERLTPCGHHKVAYNAYLYCEVVLKVYDLETGDAKDTIKYPTSNLKDAVSSYPRVLKILDKSKL